MAAKRWILAFSILLFLSSLFLVNWQADRTEFGFIISFYSLAFVAYLYIIANRSVLLFKHFLLIALGAQIVSLIFQPNLSIDYFRFLWDGEVTIAGYNPFDYTPRELYLKGISEGSEYLNEVYLGIGSMSQGNYSCYPPINQLYFIFASAFTDSIVVNTLILKLTIVATEIIGAIYLRKILLLIKIESSRMWLLYLNPLWIIECTGNAHFEGVMLSFIFIALYFLLQKKEIMGSIFFAIAIQIKLIPLMLLPFFYRFLGFWKSTIFYSLTLVIVVGLGFIQLNSGNIANFGDSLRLYFEVFEFNSFVLHYYVQYGIAETGWNMTKTYGPQLSRIAVLFIVSLALYGELTNWRILFKRMTLAFFVYLLFSSTLHPWYILPMLALSIFTNYSFPLFWSFLIFLSYVFYGYEGNPSEIRWLIDLEYVLLLGLFFYEIIARKTPIPFLRLKDNVD